MTQVTLITPSGEARFIYDRTSIYLDIENENNEKIELRIRRDGVVFKRGKEEEVELKEEAQKKEVIKKENFEDVEAKLFYQNLNINKMKIFRK